MGGLLTSGQLAVLFGACGFALGVLLAQRLKDWYNRVPAPLRAEMSKLEAGLQSKMAIELNAAMSMVKAQVGIPNLLPQTQVPVSPVIVPPGVTGPVGPS